VGVSGSVAAKTIQGEVFLIDEVGNLGTAQVKEGERLIGKLDMGGALIMSGRDLIVRASELAESTDKLPPDIAFVYDLMGYSQNTMSFVGLDRD
jgi:hypothetical protein